MLQLTECAFHLDQVKLQAARVCKIGKAKAGKKINCGKDKLQPSWDAPPCLVGLGESCLATRISQN